MRHPYKEQFSDEMDLPDQEWASSFAMIASTPRCGSHYLGHMLMETGDFGVPLEYFNKQNLKLWRARFGTDAVVDTFAEIVKRRTSQNGVFSFKAHWKQLRPVRNGVQRLTRGNGIDKVIWISRRSVLSQSISFVIARQTGAWISGAKFQKQPVYSYDKIVESAQTLNQSNWAWKKHLEANYADRYTRVVYEDLLSDATVAKEMYAFLGLTGEPKVSERTKPQGSSINAEWKARFAGEVKDDDRWVLEPASWL